MANTTTSTSLNNSGFWGSLFSNAANGVDALGRNTYSNTTAFGNMITSWIQAGKGEYPTITYQDDSAKYVTIAAIAIAVCVALIFILK